MRRSPPRSPPRVELAQHHLQHHRNREDILQDAKEAIDNSPIPMDASARSDRLAECLVASQPSDNDRLDLVRRCIPQGWVAGFNVIISGLSRNLIPPCALLHDVVAQSHLREDTQLKMILTLIAKGCNVCSFRPAVFSDIGKFVVFKNWNFGSNETVYNPHTSVGMYIYFVQAVVQNNQWKILSFILPKLDVKKFQFALIEAFGSNIKDCCDVLVDSLSARHHPSSFDFAILLASIFDRSEILETLLTNAPNALINTLQVLKFEHLNQFSRPPADAPQAQTVFEATIYFNNPKCAAIWIKKVVPSQSIDVTHLLRYCADNDFGECMKVILTNWDFSSEKEWTDSILVDILYSSLDNRRSPQLILDLVNEMKKTTGCKKCLDNLLLKCVDNNSWYYGLFIFVSSNNFKDFVGSNEEIKKNAMKTLETLVHGGRRSDTTTNIIKNLVWSLIAGEHDTNTNNRIDFAPIFKRLLLFNKDAELVRFFLSFHNNQSIMGAAEELRSSVNDENLKQEIDEALEELKKMKVKEEEEEAGLARVKLEEEDDG